MKYDAISETGELKEDIHTWDVGPSVDKATAFLERGKKVFISLKPCEDKEKERAHSATETSTLCQMGPRWGLEKDHLLVGVMSQ